MKRVLSLVLVVLGVLALWTVPAAALEPEVVWLDGDYDEVYYYGDGLFMAIQGKYPDTKYGFVDAAGQVVVPVVYDYIYSFSEGLARVERDGKYGYIDQTGREVIPAIYTSVGTFSDGLVRVCRDGKWSYMDKTGQVVIDKAGEIDFGSILEGIGANKVYVYSGNLYGASDFSEGLAAVRVNIVIDKQASVDTSPWIYIDKTGQVVIPPPYEIDSEGRLNYFFNAGDFQDGLAEVEMRSGSSLKYGLIDKTGQLVVPAVYDYIARLSGGLFQVYQDWENIGLLDQTGRVLALPEYDRMGVKYSEGMIWVRKDGKYGYLNEAGQEVVPPRYDYAYDFAEGLALVEEGEYPNKKYGFIDKTGQVVVPLIYSYARDFQDGLAQVYRDGKWGYIDKTGREVVPLIYEDIDYDYDAYEVWQFSEGLSRVYLDGKWGYVDKSGDEVIPLQYDRAEDFMDGLAVVTRGKKEGLIDKTGQVVAPIKYDWIGRGWQGVDTRMIMASLDGKYGFINSSGDVVVPFLYDDVSYFEDGFCVVKKDGRWGILKNPLDAPQAYSGTLAGDTPLSWICTSNGILTVESAIPAEESVMAASYDEQGVFLGVKVLRGDGAQRVLSGDLSRARLFRLDSGLTPAGDSVTVGKHTIDE